MVDFVLITWIVVGIAGFIVLIKWLSKVKDFAEAIDNQGDQNG